MSFALSSVAEIDSPVNSLIMKITRSLLAVSSYGAIETKTFGKFAIVKRKKKGRFSSLFRITSHNLYRAHVLYVKESDSN